MAAIQLNSHEVIVIESRRRIGYDTTREHPMGHLWTGAAQSLFDEGVLVYTVDTLRGSGWLPTRVAGDNGDLEHNVYPLLAAGESLTVENSTINVTTDDGHTHTVTIARGR